MPGHGMPAMGEIYEGDAQRRAELDAEWLMELDSRVRLELDGHHGRNELG